MYFIQVTILFDSVDRMMLMMMMMMVVVVVVVVVIPAVK